MAGALGRMEAPRVPGTPVRSGKAKQSGELDMAKVRARLYERLNCMGPRESQGLPEAPRASPMPCASPLPEAGRGKAGTGARVPQTAWYSPREGSPGPCGSQLDSPRSDASSRSCGGLHSPPDIAAVADNSATDGDFSDEDLSVESPRRALSIGESSASSSMVPPVSALAVRRSSAPGSSTPFSCPEARPEVVTPTAAPPTMRPLSSQIARRRLSLEGRARIAPPSPCGAAAAAAAASRRPRSAKGQQQPEFLLSPRPSPPQSPAPGQEVASEAVALEAIAGGCNWCKPMPNIVPRGFKGSHLVRRRSADTPRTAPNTFAVAPPAVAANRGSGKSAGRRRFL